MEKVAHFILIVVLIILVVTGLNVSNRGVNLLTGEKRGPVVGVTVNGQHVGVQWLGDNYVCDRQTLEGGLKYVKAGSRAAWQQASRCLEMMHKAYQDLLRQIQ